MTPDGSRVVYAGNKGTQLFVRPLDALAPVAVFTGAPLGPFISPDGQWIGFEDRAVLKKVAMTGGPAVTLARPDGNLRGATWGSDDTIIYATTNVLSGLQRVGEAGYVGGQEDMMEDAALTLARRAADASEKAVA